MPDGGSFHGLATIGLSVEAARAGCINVGRIESEAFVEHRCVDCPDVRDRLDLAVIGRVEVLDQINFFDLELPGEVTAEIGQIGFFGHLARVNELVAPKLDAFDRKIEPHGVAGGVCAFEGEAAKEA